MNNLQKTVQSPRMFLDINWTSFRYQCTVCKSNIDDCCSGDTCQPTMSTLKEEDLINHEVKA